jgi:5-methylcytosine-specific restriction protein A
MRRVLKKCHARGMGDPRSTRRWRKLRLVILARDHYTCALCRRLANHVDHIVPIARGGAMWNPSNLRTLCRQCNLSLGGRLAQQLAGRRRGQRRAGSERVHWGALRP